MPAGERLCCAICVTVSCILAQLGCFIDQSTFSPRTIRFFYKLLHITEPSIDLGKLKVLILLLFN